MFEYKVCYQPRGFVSGWYCLTSMDTSVVEKFGCLLPSRVHCGYCMINKMIFSISWSSCINIYCNENIFGHLFFNRFIDLYYGHDLWPCGLCFSGGAVQQNGHTTTEIQEEVALTNMGTMATTEKRHSHVNNDKLHFPRANLQTITTLGMTYRLVI